MIKVKLQKQGKRWVCVEVTTESRGSFTKKPSRTALVKWLRKNGLSLAVSEELYIEEYPEA